jgi:hypothetical protein
MAGRIDGLNVNSPGGNNDHSTLQTKLPTARKARISGVFQNMMSSRLE